MLGFKYPLEGTLPTQAATLFPLFPYFKWAPPGRDLHFGVIQQHSSPIESQCYSIVGTKISIIQKLYYYYFFQIAGKHVGSSITFGRNQILHITTDTTLLRITQQGCVVFLRGNILLWGCLCTLWPSYLLPLWAIPFFAIEQSAVKMCKPKKTTIKSTCPFLR